VEKRSGCRNTDENRIEQCFAAHIVLFSIFFSYFPPKNFPREEVFPNNHLLHYGHKNFSGQITSETWPKPVF
jgi:hypothetical protein